MPHTHHIILAGGGTAGHLFPGLAVAEALAASGLMLQLTVFGSGKPFEREHVATAGHDYVPLRCRPLPTHPGEAWRFLADNLSGYYTARRFLRQNDVSLIVGLGGYASAAATRAAASRRIPYILLEQNVVPGKATRWLASRATAICAGFVEARAHLRVAARVRVTGTPVRSEFARLGCPLAPGADRGLPPRLIVLGGSGGSRTLNENVPRAIYKARAALAGWEIVHQTGGHDAQATALIYGKLGLSARVAPFFADLPQLLATSALAVSRAGGTTLAELAVCGVPSILVPYPHAADNHQRRNAESFVAAGAARMVDARDVEGRLDNALARACAAGRRRRAPSPDGAERGALRPARRGRARRQSDSANHRRPATSGGVARLRRSSRPHNGAGPRSPAAIAPGARRIIT